MRESRQFRWIKVQANFVSRTEHHQLIVQHGQQRQDVAVAGVGSCRTRIWPGRANLFVNVLHVARRRAFDLQRVAVGTKTGTDERDWRQTDALIVFSQILRRAVYQNVVPINLEIGNDANLLRACGQLACEISGHCAWTTGGEAHVVDNSHPLAVCCERLHIRRDGLHASL